MIRDPFCCGECFDHPCPAERCHPQDISREVSGGMVVITYVVAAWIVTALLALLLALVWLAAMLWPQPARASDLDAVRLAAKTAYFNREIVTSDGVLDCDDNMLVAWKVLAENGIGSTPQFCTRNGNPHTWLKVGNLAIDNRYPYPVAPRDVGCDD